MQLKKTLIKNLFIITPSKNNDSRGYFEKQFCIDKFKKKNLTTTFKQINRAFNKKKFTFRGMHYQTKPYEETKIIQCVKGKVLDIVLDLRKKSKTYLNTQCFLLSEKKNDMLYVPKGVAHGYLTLENKTELLYFHSNIYNKKSSKGICIFDKKIKFKLRKKIKIISPQDKKLKFLDEM